MTWQGLIRWGLQRYPSHFTSIPKSSDAGRIAQNLDATGWQLSAEAMESLDGLNCDFRYFISYLKRPDNDARWHDGRIEKGDDSDFV